MFSHLRSHFMNYHSQLADLQASRYIFMKKRERDKRERERERIETEMEGNGWRSSGGSKERRKRAGKEEGKEIVYKQVLVYQTSKFTKH